MSITCMPEKLPKSGQEPEVEPEKTQGTEDVSDGDANSVPVETERPLVERMRETKDEHDEILAEAYRWVIADLTPGVTIFLAVASAAGVLLLIGWYSGRRSRGQRYGNTKVDFFPARPDSIVVNR